MGVPNWGRWAGWIGESVGVLDLMGVLDLKSVGVLKFATVGVLEPMPAEVCVPRRIMGVPNCGR